MHFDSPPISFYSPTTLHLLPSVGFLQDDRRANVAMTRARRGLVVVGHADTLSTDPTWSAWLTWAKVCRDVNAHRTTDPPTHRTTI